MDVGLDPDLLDMVLAAIGDFARAELPAAKLLEYDEKDIVPLEIVRDMCSDKLGIQLLFIPEEYGGMGGGAFDVYRVCERMAAIDLGRRDRRCSRRSSAATRSRSAGRRSRRSDWHDAGSPRRACCSPTAPPSPRRAATSAR